jgi:magnesium transporter
VRAAALSYNEQPARFEVIMLYCFPYTGSPHGEIGASTVWVDLHDPSPAEIEQVTQFYKMRVPARTELDEIESSSRLRLQGDVLYLSMPIVVYSDAGEPFPAPIGFVLSQKILITIRYSEPHAFTTARARLGKQGGAADSADAFVVLLEETVDFGADILEKMAAELGGISKRAFRPQAERSHRIARTTKALRAMLTQVGNIGEHLSYSRETILGLQRIIGFICDSACHWLKPDIHARLTTARHDLESLADYDAHLSNKVQFLLDAILGFLNTEQNDIFKVLTIVSVVGIPPTLIASMYGMNFHNIPEYSWSWGYQWGLGLIALSTILPVAWFKWRGWW